MAFPWMPHVAVTPEAHALMRDMHPLDPTEYEYVQTLIDPETAVKIAETDDAAARVLNGFFAALFTEDEFLDGPDLDHEEDEDEDVPAWSDDLIAKLDAVPTNASRLGGTVGSVEMGLLYALVFLKAYLPTRFATFNPPTEVRTIARDLPRNDPPAQASCRPLVLTYNAYFTSFTKEENVDGKEVDVVYKTRYDDAMITSFVTWLKDQSSAPLFFIPLSEVYLKDGAHIALAVIDKTTKKIDVFNAALEKSVVVFLYSVKKRDSLVHQILSAYSEPIFHGIEQGYLHISADADMEVREPDNACSSWAALYLFLRARDAKLQRDPTEYSAAFGYASRSTNNTMFSRVYQFGRQVVRWGKIVLDHHVQALTNTVYMQELEGWASKLGPKPKAEAVRDYMIASQVLAGDLVAEMGYTPDFKRRPSQVKAIRELIDLHNSLIDTLG